MSSDIIHLLSASCPGRLGHHHSVHLPRRDHYLWPYCVRQQGICVGSLPRGLEVAINGTSTNIPNKKGLKSS